MAVNKKMYWKSGFFDYPIKDCVEISVEYWQELLDGQSSGKEDKEKPTGILYWSSMNIRLTN